MKEHKEVHRNEVWSVIDLNELKCSKNGECTLFEYYCCKFVK